MMIRFSIFGVEIFCLTLGAEPLVLLEEGDDGVTEIMGGSGHDFERDLTPLNPDDRYDWEFGFQEPK